MTSLDEALSLPDIDAVTVSTPPDAHTEPILAAIARGKHVLCEKPFALNAVDGQAMHDAAVAAGVVHMCAFEFRWRDPAHRHIWDFAFTGGSFIAAFMQGIMLGALYALSWITGLAAAAAGATGVVGFCWYCVTKLGEKSVEHVATPKLH